MMTRIADRPSPSSAAAAAPTAASTSDSPPAYSRRAPAPTASATSSVPPPRQPTVGSGPSAAADGTEMLDTSGSSFSSDGWLGSQPSQTLPPLCRPPPPPSTVTSIGMAVRVSPGQRRGSNTEPQAAEDEWLMNAVMDLRIYWIYDTDLIYGMVYLLFHGKLANWQVYWQLRLHRRRASMLGCRLEAVISQRTCAQG